MPFECGGPPVAEELPTEEELQALPRRAIVVYAARGDYDRLRSICPQALPDLGGPDRSW